ncbi:hypothetical protein [Tenacibaculum sp. SDUM215027]|uniref:hypothetical protein n=1 Tax=Tenacibaculum sp. SDUM215027 TaxID=3422596 RepID=UPI003D31BA79
MKGSTKLERELYEQYIILEKYGGEISRKGKYLLNKVNPVGGRYKLGTPLGEKEFYEAAEKVIKKYNLPSTF